MKLGESSDEIVIRHAPVGKWIFGGIFAFIFVFLCVLLISSALNRTQWLFGIDAKVLFETLPFVVFAIAFFVVAVFEISFVSLIFAPLTTIRINKKTGSVDITRRRFYGVRTERFYFYQIKKFKSYKAKLNFSSKYFLALVLANQKTIKLRIPVGVDKLETIKLVRKLNRFIKSFAATASQGGR